MGSSRDVVRIAGVATASVAALVGGIVHLKLYNDGYKDIPVGHIGAQFILNAIGAVLIAGGLLGSQFIRAMPRAASVAAAAGGVLWAAIALIAFARARTSSGWFGFTDQPGLNPSPEAALAVFAEAITLGSCLVVLVVAVVSGDLRGRTPVAAPGL